MDLGILNTVIALVIVLLVLSLLVQAIQTLLKKLLKLKSRQIEDSLKDLYEQVVGAQTTTTSGFLLPRFWLKLKSWLGMKSAIVTSPADVFTDKVLDQFKSIGRQTLFGNAVLESLSKGDLFKVMGKLESEDFFPDYVPKFQLLCDRIKDLREAIDAITNDPMLRGAASTKIAEIRSILAPIFNNVSSILEGTQVKPKVLFADLLRLGKLDVHGLLDLLDEAQEAITRETELASSAGNAGEVAAFQKLSAELAQVAKLIGDLSQKFVDAISPLRNKIEQVELWFDTVTQSFDERYSRNMRTISLVISILVVILLNANFFQVYRSLSKNEIQRNMVADAGADLLKQLQNAQASETPKPQPSRSPTPNDNATPSTTPEPDTVVELKKDFQAIDSFVGTYEGFGFKPLSIEQLQGFIWSTGIWTRPWSDDYGNYGWGGFKLNKELIDGNEISHWQVQNGAEWWESRKSNGQTIVGWAIMIMLLSVGAPFWQDALESLFGIKNLLRQKSGTQNIEAQSGTGQPKE
ncbi:MAG TPA: hypothetical protein VGQ41_16660 [Pyrinomonadaceae bacterium]|jgi:hypothetical protein|nr:hypothetical protein [Pyrinomonadaceae bacterium]